MKYSCILFVYFFCAALSALSQNTAIYNDRMNILYKYAPNSIRIMVPNVPCKNLVVQTKVGTLTSSEIYDDKCHFYYWCNDCNAKSEQIKIGIKRKGKIKGIDSTSFRLFEDAKKSIQINVFGCRGDNTCKIKQVFFKLDSLDIEFGNYPGVNAPLINWDISLNYPVVKYSVEITRNDSIIYREIDVEQERFSNNFMSKVLACQPGDKYRFFNVNVKI